MKRQSSDTRGPERTSVWRVQTHSQDFMRTCWVQVPFFLLKKMSSYFMTPYFYDTLEIYNQTRYTNEPTQDQQPCNLFSVKLKNTIYNRPYLFMQQLRHLRWNVDLDRIWFISVIDLELNTFCSPLLTAYSFHSCGVYKPSWFECFVEDYGNKRMISDVDWKVRLWRWKWTTEISLCPRHCNSSTITLHWLECYVRSYKNIPEKNHWQHN